MADNCLVEGCTGEVKSRGLCQVCFVYAHRLVNNGKTTWEELEQQGKVKRAHAQSLTKRRREHFLGA